WKSRNTNVVGALRPATQHRTKPRIMPGKNKCGASRRRNRASSPAAAGILFMVSTRPTASAASKRQVNERLDRQSHAVQRVVQDDPHQHAREQRQQPAQVFHGSSPARYPKRRASARIAGASSWASFAPPEAVK